MHLRIRLLPQECLVGVHRIPSKQSPLRLWHEILDVVEQICGRLFWSHFRSDYFRSEATFSMGVRTPFTLDARSDQLRQRDRWTMYHLIHPFLLLVDHCSPSTLIHNVQVSIRYDAEYLNYNIIFDIQARHLCIVSLSSSNTVRLLSGTYLTINPD